MGSATLDSMPSAKSTQTDKNDNNDNSDTCRFNNPFNPSDIKTASGGVVVIVGLNATVASQLICHKVVWSSLEPSSGLNDASILNT